MRVRRGAMTSALMVVALMLGASSTASATVSDAKPKRAAKTTFVARVPGTDAYIGIVLGKRSAVAYLCDGAKLEKWFTGATTNGIVALEAENGSALVARRAGNKLRGTVVLADNRTLRFDAVPARGKAGLFRRVVTEEGARQTQTWIRLADGTARGAGAAVDQSANGARPGAGPGGQSDGVFDPTPDDGSVPPQAPCPPGALPAGFAYIGREAHEAIGIGFVCGDVPPIDVPDQPPDDAVTPTPPPVAETIAGRVADATNAGDAPVLGPLVVALPESGAFDATACSRISRALALLADELDALEPDSVTRFVFASVFSHLRDRGTLGGCPGLVAAP